MPYSANPSVKKCQGDCGLRKPSAEYADPGPQDRVCRACREAHQPPAPVPLGDGRTAITLVGKHAHGRVTLVSDARVPQIAPYRWRVMEQIRKDGTKVGPYAVTKIPTGKRGGRMAYMHSIDQRCIHRTVPLAAAVVSAIPMIARATSTSDLTGEPDTTGAVTTW